MKTKPQTNRTAPGISEALRTRNALAGVGHALALSIQQSDPKLNAYEKDDALAILEGIRCFFELAKVDSGDPDCRIDVLTELFDAAMALCDAHPGLWSLAVAMSRLGMGSDDDGIPF